MMKSYGLSLIFCFFTLLLFSCAESGTVDKRGFGDSVANLADKQNIISQSPSSLVKDPEEEENKEEASTITDDEEVTESDSEEVDDPNADENDPNMDESDPNATETDANDSSGEDTASTSDTTLYCADGLTLVANDLDCDGALNEDDIFPEDEAVSSCDVTFSGDANSLQEVTEDANDDFVICVEPGRYYENISFSEYDKDLKIYCLEQELNSDEEYECTLDGSGTDRVLELNSANSTPETIISGFNIENGYHYNGSGGGIRVENGAPTLKNLRFYKNEVTCDEEGDGEADTLDDGSTADDCHGGGLSIKETSEEVVYKNMMFVSNEAFKGGGGIYISGTELVMDNITVQNNKAGASGGGIQCTESGKLTLTNSLIASNSSESKGGGFFSWACGGSILANSTFSKNKATGDKGGGIALQRTNEDGEPYFLYNLLISENSSTSNGGGIASIVDDEPSFRVYGANLTIVDNIADIHGGGIQAGSSGTDGYIATLTLVNSIVQGNLSNNDESDDEESDGVVGAGDQIYFASETVAADSSVRYSNIGCLAGDIEDQDHGFCVENLFHDEDKTNINEASPFDDSGDYILGKEAYSIDSGVSEVKFLVPVNLCTEYPDLAGASRCVDGDSDETVSIDIGAFEYQP